MMGQVGGASTPRGTSEMADVLLEIRSMTPERLAEIRDTVKQLNESRAAHDEAKAAAAAEREAAEKAKAEAIAEREAADRTIRLAAREKVSLADERARVKREQEAEAQRLAEWAAQLRRSQTRIERAAHDALAALAETAA